MPARSMNMRCMCVCQHECEMLACVCASSSSSMLKTSQGGIDLAVEQCQGIVSQLAKNTLFGRSEERRVGKEC